jgi:Bax protein
MNARAFGPGPERRRRLWQTTKINGWSALLGLAAALWTAAPAASPLNSKSRAAADPGLGSARLSTSAHYDALPAFHEIEHVPERKREFFDYLTPLVQQENQRILEDRKRLLSLRRGWEAGRGATASDRAFVRRLARDYQLEPRRSYRGTLDELLHRVDVIPHSLVLAQAAKESAWGSSRFARQANNLFGQWCFERGCGLVPRKRPHGATHEVRRFPTVGASVSSYVRNLNTHASYQRLRDLRAAQRAAGEALSGVRLAEGLERYSARGRAYVDDVRTLIVQNDLEPARSAGEPAADVALSTP